MMIVQYRGEAVTALELSGSRIASEAAARILFMCVRWVKSVPAFRCLTESDQRVLLQNGWRDLFLLTAAQLSSTFDLRPVASADPSHLSGQYNMYRLGSMVEQPAVSRSHDRLAAGQHQCFYAEVPPPPRSIIWYWYNGWEVNRHTMWRTSPISVVSQCQLLNWRSAPPSESRDVEKTLLTYMCSAC